MRRKILWSLSGVSAAAVVAACAWLSRSPDDAGPRRVRRVAGTVEIEPQAAPADARQLARALPAPPKGVAADEIRALIREAAEAYRSKDAERFNLAFKRLLDHGSAIQRLLAEYLLETHEAEERLVAGLALLQVATAEIGPFATALVGADVAEDVKGVAIDLLTKFRVAEAAAVLETLLFQEGTSADLRRRTIGYFTEIGGAAVLARAAIEPAFEDLRTLAAEGLAKIGTPEAARLLLSAWRKTFVGKGEQALDHYFLLQALAKFAPATLRVLVKEFLRTESDPSARNVFLSMLAKADRGLALETIREVLAQEKSSPLRRQALRVLGSLGGPEAQEILLGILADARQPKEIVDCANALLQQERLDVAFDKVRLLFGSARDPMIRVLLAGLLAKYEVDLAGDPALAAQLRKEAEEGMASADPAVRGLSIQLATTLAQYGTDPATNLIDLYGGLSAKEREAYPVVLAELSKRNEDPRVRTILERALADEDAGAPSRLLAADALLASGGEERVYGAIASAKGAEMTTLMAGMALARGGDEAASRLERIAQTTEDPAKRQAITDQLKAWSAASK